MDDHQHAGPVGQFVDIASEGLDVEELFHLGQQNLLGHPHLRIAGKSESIKKGNHGLTAPSEFRDQARKVVFQEILTLGRKQPDEPASGR